LKKLTTLTGKEKEMGDVYQAAGSLESFVVIGLIVAAIGYVVWCKGREKAGKGKCFFTKE
jgi:hypothetical protein